MVYGSRHRRPHGMAHLIGVRAAIIFHKLATRHRLQRIRPAYQVLPFAYDQQGIAEQAELPVLIWRHTPKPSRTALFRQPI